MSSEKTAQMKKIRDEVLELTDSPLYEYRTTNNYFPVIGEGNHDADIVFVGEAPGKNEAKTGRPFCGAAGKLLDELLEHVGIKRSDVYITNILKDRPPGNRDPLAEEIEIYTPFLDRQIEIIEPKVVATLGRFAMEYIMRKYGLDDKLGKISAVHGNVFEVQNFFDGSIKIVPLYHPAVAIYNRNEKPTLEKDFEVLMDIVS